MYSIRVRQAAAVIIKRVTHTIKYARVHCTIRCDMTGEFGDGAGQVVCWLWPR